MDLTNLIYQPARVTVEDIYTTTTPMLPEGYEVVSFREVSMGDIYISKVQAMRMRPVPTKHVGVKIDGPRLILRKIPALQKLVRVVRVLEYVGPADWIEGTLNRNGVKGFQVVGLDRTIRELSVFKEEVK